MSNTWVIVLIAIIVIIGTIFYLPSFNEQNKIEAKPVVTLKPDTLPTYNQVIQFIKYDKTNELKYTETEFSCVDFARTLKNNANQHNIKTAVVFIGLALSGYPTYGHAIDCFETSDKGLIYIDPQSDSELFNIEPGQYYQYGLYELEITKVDYIW